jgi:hypothetical protein
MLPGALTKTGKDRIPFAPKGRLAGVLAMRRHDPAGDALPADAAARRAAPGSHRIRTRRPTTPRRHGCVARGEPREHVALMGGAEERI